jgi:hypothetical protein
MSFVVKQQLVDLVGGVPRRWFRVDGAGGEAAVQDADQAVAQLAERGVVAGAAGARLVVVGAGARLVVVGAGAG